VYTVIRKAIPFYYVPVVGGGALSDTAIRPPVCPSLGYSTLAAWRSCLGYWHAGTCSWPATIDVRTADPSADGRRSAASRTAIGGGISRRRPRGDNLFSNKSVFGYVR